MADLEDISSKIKSQLYKIVKKQKTRSVAWEHFGEIKNERDDVIPNIAGCRSCYSVLHVHKNATTNLLNHSCVKKSRPSSSNAVQVNSTDKKLILDVCTNICIKDLRPFSTITGNGFKEFTKMCIKMGAKYGEYVDVNNMLPDSTTVSNDVKRIINKTQPLIIQELSTVDKMAATVDMWTDEYRRQSFLSVTVHYIKNDKLYELVLAVAQMEDRSTGVKLLEKLQSIFRSYGVIDLNNIIFVTDRGSNIIKSLQGYQRYNCMDHLYNNVLEKACDETQEIADFFTSCRKLVSFFKKSSNLLTKLSSTLKLDCATRWNSKYEMCESISRNLSAITPILTEKNKTHLINGINTHILMEMVELLRPFKDFSVKLQASNEPTLYLVLPFYHCLKKYCLHKETDSEPTKKFKTKISHHLDTLVLPNITTLHKAATFLYPPCKDLKILPQHEIYDIYEFIKEKVSFDYPNPHNVSPRPSPEISTSCSMSRIFDDFSNSNSTLLCTDFETSGSRSSNLIDLNIRKYLNMEIERQDINIMEWWLEHKLTLKYLYKAHTEINCVPAASAASERIFSSAGNIISEKRSRISPDIVNNIIVTNSYYKAYGNW